MHSLYQFLFIQSNSYEESLFNFIPFNNSGFSVSYIILCDSFPLNSISKGDTEVIFVPMFDIMTSSLFVNSSNLNLYKILILSKFLDFMLPNDIFPSVVALQRSNNLS